MLSADRYTDEQLEQGTWGEVLFALGLVVLTAWLVVWAFGLEPAPVEPAPPQAKEAR